jgi:hypothetical protein
MRSKKEYWKLRGLAAVLIWINVNFCGADRGATATW